MGALGRVVGVFFFVVLAVGAITSAISLLEVVTASMMDEAGMSRRKAALLAGSAITLVGIVPAMDTDALGLLDKIAGELLLLAGGLILAVFAAWLRSDEIRDELLAGASPFWQRQVPRILAVLRYVAPPVVAVVLIFSLRETIAAVAAFLAG
jgi:NSS family neurotransmitter:Na+ symporter